MKEIINEIKKKKEFSKLPDSIVERAAKLSGGDVKEARALLRKYFGVFLTNKVLKGKFFPEDILKSHISSKNRDYKIFYEEIFEEINDVGSIIDLGCGVNGFSYNLLKDITGEIEYFGIEASRQLVDNMNYYFKKSGVGICCKAINLDIFEIDKVINILKKAKKPRIVFMFQLIDALENFEKDFSKKFLLGISKECEMIVLTLPLFSLGGRKRFVVQRKWLTDFLKDNFKIEKDFKIGNERVIILKSP